MVGITLSLCYCFRMAKTKTTKRKSVQPIDKPFACHCGTRFLRQTYLNVHMRKFHPEEIPESKSMPRVGKAELVSKVPEPKSVPKAPENNFPDMGPSTSRGFVLNDLSSPEGCEVLDPYDLDSDKESEKVNSSSEDSDDSESSKDVSFGKKEIPVEKPELDSKEISDEEPGLDGKEEIPNVEQGVDSKKEEIPDGLPELYDRKEVDSRIVNELYLGRMRCKATRPQRPLAPIKRSMIETGCMGKGETRVQPTSEIDEVQINVNQETKKRIVFKMPDGKKLKLDVSFE